MGQRGDAPPPDEAFAREAGYEYLRKKLDVTEAELLKSN
jgi:hypothetical protein